MILWIFVGLVGQRAVISMVLLISSGCQGTYRKGLTLPSKVQVIVDKMMEDDKVKEIVSHSASCNITDEMKRVIYDAVDAGADMGYSEGWEEGLERIRTLAWQEIQR